MANALDTIQQYGFLLRNRRGAEEFLNPLDVDTSIAIGIDLPFGEPNAGRYPTYTSGSSVSLADGDQDVSTSRIGSPFRLNYTTRDQVQANIRNLVLTSPGERAYHPNLGGGIYELLFDNSTDDVLDKLEEAVSTQIAYWLPYVDVKDVNVTRAKDNDNMVNIGITYTTYQNLDVNLLDITV